MLWFTWIAIKDIFIEPFPSCIYLGFKTSLVLVQNLSYGNEFFLHVHCLENEMAYFFQRGPNRSRASWKLTNIPFAVFGQMLSLEFLWKHSTRSRKSSLSSSFSGSFFLSLSSVLRLSRNFPGSCKIGWRAKLWHWEVSLNLAKRRPVYYSSNLELFLDMVSGPTRMLPRKHVSSMVS